MEIVNLWKRNSKLEIIVLFCTLVAVILWCSYAPAYNMMEPILQKANNYFSVGRLSNLTEFFAITIGVYIAVISILATSVIGLSPALLADRLDESLIFVTKVACWENVLAVLMGTFCPIHIAPWSMLYFGLLSVSVISFVKFLRIMFLIFQGNMQKMAEEIDRNMQDRNEIFLKLDNIEQDIEKIKHIKESEGKNGTIVDGRKEIHK